MQTIEFTPEEKDVLSEVLAHEIEGINIEVFRTDTHDFKEMLKYRRAVLEHLLEKISSVSVPV
jgi:hypothetical protein